MRFMQNNEDDSVKEFTLECTSCGMQWSPFGRSGIAMCGNCGRDWVDGGFKRVNE